MKVAAIAPFGLRMPPDVKMWVSDLARANDRSVNMEIVRILRERMVAATGVKFGDQAPAAASNANAFQGAASTHGL